ncbi:MAG: glycerol-3-phosphate dehydrogenase/oxidase [Deltaproteobacteria bacterium]|nr:glycerol-3-phosphate dehydrogenase/oxidase [Deltaproteobacteria bacterium]
MNTCPQEHRRDTCRRLTRDLFDVVIIGGGITGASIARDAALRGYRVALLEQDDLAYGTSSRSSRLVHGGLRYLEMGQLGLVFESVSERAALARLARHIVRPLPFVFPVYQGDGLPLFAVDFGLWIYDGLALFRNYENHSKLSAAEVGEVLPGLNAEGLKGAVRYYDYQTDDARLVLENALGAMEAGAEVLPRCRVEKLDYRRGRIVQVLARDRITDEQFTVRGRVFICAAGPWTDEVLALSQRPEGWMRPAKGVHIVVPKSRLPVDEALLVKHPEDGRVLFILPYHERTVIGTTDTDSHEDPGALQASGEDVRYLLATAHAYFPASKLTPEDVISNWIGVRPLLQEEDEGAPSSVSREHKIHVRSDNLVVIAGGKLTTYRRMAAECLDQAERPIIMAGGPIPRGKGLTSSLPLPGSVGLEADHDLSKMIADLGREVGDAAVGEHLALTYGVRARQVIDLATDELCKRVDAELPFIWAEIIFAARFELACALEDVLKRRTHIFYRSRDQGLSIAARVSELLAQELGWDDVERREQLNAYQALVAESRAWRDDPCFMEKL